MFEQNLQKGMFQGTSEKTFIDKILAREDVNAIKILIKKNNLTREELLEILYLVVGTESKLLNYGEWDRYVILKFFIWLREFVKVTEILFDYIDYIERKSNECQKCHKLVKGVKDACKCKEPRILFHVQHRTKVLIGNIMRMMEHNVKFLIDLYLNIGRTSLSVGATGMLEILKNKYEVDYRNTAPMTQPQQGGGFLGLRK